MAARPGRPAGSGQGAMKPPDPAPPRRDLSVSSLAEDPELLDAARSFGFGLEYSGFVDPRAQGPESVEAFMRSSLRERVVAMHGPFVDLMPGSMDEEVDAVARRRISRGIEICAQTGIAGIVLHTGWFPKTYPDELWLGNALRFWEAMTGGLRSGAAIYLENVYEEGPELLAELLDRLGDRRVRACLDLGHAHANSRLSVAGWIEALGHRIGRVHLHNNHGSRDEHNGLEGGTIDIEAACGLLERLCPGAAWNLEIMNGYAASMRLLSRLRPGPPPASGPSLTDAGGGSTIARSRRHGEPAGPPEA